MMMKCRSELIKKYVPLVQRSIAAAHKASSLDSLENTLVSQELIQGKPDTAILKGERIVGISSSPPPEA